MSAILPLAAAAAIAAASAVKRSGSRAMPRDLSDRVEDLEFDMRAILRGADRPSELARRRNEAVLAARMELEPVVRQIQEAERRGADASLLRRGLQRRMRELGLPPEGSSARWLGRHTQEEPFQVARRAMALLAEQGVSVPATTTPLGSGKEAYTFNTESREIIVRVGLNDRDPMKEFLFLDDRFKGGVARTIAVTRLGHAIVSWKERVDPDVLEFLLKRYLDNGRKDDYWAIVNALHELYNASKANLKTLSQYPETQGLAAAIRAGLPPEDLDLYSNIGVTQDARIVAYDI